MSILNGDDQEPDGMNLFKILQSSSSYIGPRLGTLALTLRGRVDTPHYVGITSRGVVPHLSPDTLRARTSLKGVYMALEDFVEKAPSKTPPVFLQPVESGRSRLRDFPALPDEYVLILGLRRTPPVPSPSANTQTSVSICTAVGFSQHTSESYVEAVKKLQPDIVVALGDIPYGEKPGSRRTEKMSGRTERWLKELLNGMAAAEGAAESSAPSPQVFAPILPIGSELQSFYLDMLADDDMKRAVAGLAVYDPDSVADIPDPLLAKPRLSVTNPTTPHQLLREVSLGIDMFTIPFINAATDAGIALDFTFPAPTKPTPTEPQALGVDLWLDAHAASLAPLTASCTCNTCTTHHRAYVQHLLNAKEMLAWVLLQVHNLHVVDAFFAGVRASIAAGAFERDCAAFARAYEQAMPEKTGRGPRVRGYQFKSEGGGEARKNAPAYRMLDDKTQGVAEAAGLAANVSAKDLEVQGFAGKDAGR